MRIYTAINSIKANRGWMPYFVLAISLTVTVFGAAGVWIVSETQERSRFENAVQSTQDTVRDRLEIYTLLLRGTGAMFSTKIGLVPDEFHTYVESLDINDRYPGVRGIGWTIRLTPQQVPELEAVMRKSVRGDFRVWPMEPKRQEYHSIVYLEPLDERNRQAIGFDMHSEATRAEAMDRARDTGEVAASGLVRLVQEIDSSPQPGFLIFLPVYRGQGMPESLEDRRARLAGFVYCPFRAGDLLTGIFGSQTAPLVEFEIYDGGGTNLSDDNLLFRSAERPPGTGSARLTSESLLNVAGRTWTLRFASRPDLERAAGRDSGMGIAVVGTLISLLLFALTRAQTHAREIAERTTEALQKREAALRISETRFRSLFTQSPVTIQLFSPDGTTIAVNDAWEELWQSSKDLVEGYNVLKDPALIGDPALDSLRRAFAGEIIELPPRWFDPSARGMQGRGRWVESFIYPIKNDDGQVSEVVLMLVDVTDRLEAERNVTRSERRYRSLVSATAQIVWTTNATGEVVEDLPSWREFTGQSLKEIGGFGWSDAVHPDDRERVQRIWRKSLETGATHEQEFRVRRRDGQWRDIVARAVPVPEEDGSVREWVGTCSDITDRKRFETERDFLLTAERAARAEAERANKLKDEFLATMSHELRTPLNAILGWAQLLRTTNDEDEITNGLETIERNAKAQARLVDDLLDVSRIIAGKLRLELQPVDLDSVIHSALESARPLLDEKTIRLKLELHPSAPVVTGDPHRLQQIIWNLLSNAVKFTPAGGRITVSLRCDGTSAIISVADTGCGIPADFLPHVFDRFRQADASTTRRFGGLGLGLGIVRHLVELHHGAVVAASEGQGRGSTFTLSLPLNQAASAHDAAPISANESATLTGGSTASTQPRRDILSGLRILVVEDDPDSRELMKSLIETQGGEALTVGSTAAAIESFLRGKPDILVSDISMPVEDGYVLIERVRGLEKSRDLHPRVPAIALTALARAEDHVRAIAAGFDLHISKPIENRLLVESIARLAGRLSASNPTIAVPR